MKKKVEKKKISKGLNTFNGNMSTATEVASLLESVKIIPTPIRNIFFCVNAVGVTLDTAINVTMKSDK